MQFGRILIVKTEKYTAEQIAEFKKRTAMYLQDVMGVRELVGILNEAMARGDGDAMVAVSDGHGGTYSVSRKARARTLKGDAELFGKWCEIG